MGLIPLYAVEVLEPEALEGLPGFKRRMQWFLDNVPNVPHHIEMTQNSAHGIRRQLSIVSRRKLVRILRYMLDEQEFLAPHGIRRRVEVPCAEPLCADDQRSGVSG